MYITSTTHSKHRTTLHVASPVTSVSLHYITPLGSAHSLPPSPAAAASPQPGAMVPRCACMPRLRVSGQASVLLCVHPHISYSWTDATRSHSLCGALTGDRRASVIKGYEDIDAAQRICGCFYVC